MFLFYFRFVLYVFQVSCDGGTQGVCSVLLFPFKFKICSSISDLFLGTTFSGSLNFIRFDVLSEYLTFVEALDKSLLLLREVGLLSLTGFIFRQLSCFLMELKTNLATLMAVSRRWWIEPSRKTERQTTLVTIKRVF
jgi:hypothetical protein